MLRTVHLHGPLKERFGGSYEFDVDNTVDAIRALRANFPGFERELIDGRFQIVRGDLDDGLQLGEEELTLNLGRARDLHIVPVLEGAGGDGVGKVVLGVAIMGIAFTGAWMAGASFIGPLAAGQTTMGVGMGMSAVAGISWGTIASFGVAMTLGGISALLSPSPEFNSIEPREGNESFLFTGPLNTTEQGVPVPVVYGRMRVGSVLASSQIESEEVEDTDVDNEDEVLTRYFSWPNINAQGNQGTTYNKAGAMLPGLNMWAAGVGKAVSYTLRMTVVPDGAAPTRVQWMKLEPGSDQGSPIAVAWQGGSYQTRNHSSNTLTRIGVRVEGPMGSARKGQIQLHRVDGGGSELVDTINYNLGGIWVPTGGGGNP